MTAAELRDEVVAALLAVAWDQWSQLGVSAAAPAQREERAADPEALLLFTFEVGRNDPRLFDEVLDWLALNEQLVSVHRLRNLSVDPTDRALVEAALEWSARSRRRQRPALQPRALPARLDPLFPVIPTPTENLDEPFAQHALARTQLEASGQSRAPRLHDPISFAFRLRRLLGVGVRAEAIRTLLTIRAARLSGKVITASAAFAQRNVREGLAQLVDAGVVDVVEISDDRYYSIRHADWASLLGMPSAPDLPLHCDWIPTYRALTRIVRWLQRPGLDDLSPYLRASQARTLVDAIAPDLQHAGIPVAAYTALGVDFWDEFAELVRATIRAARAQR